MPSIFSISTYAPPHKLHQNDTMEFARELFSESYEDIERLLTVFGNGQIDERYFAAPMDWFHQPHTLKERNDLFIELAVKYGVAAIRNCLQDSQFLKRRIGVDEVDAIICVTSTGMSTPGLEARMMNQLSFDEHTKRIPIWGLGCAGGAAGLSRAFDYCLAHPKENVLLVCVELCSLTFQHNDHSKSNLIGTSLFADGVACALVGGDQSQLRYDLVKETSPGYRGSQSTLMPQSEDVMGWDVRDTGLHVIFSRSIPGIVEKWLKPNVEEFLQNQGIELSKVDAFIAHPGGKKVLESYEKALGFSTEKTDVSREVLRKFGNMSSPTVLYVLKEFMKEDHPLGYQGLVAALGPGFCSELVHLEWEGHIH
ncbi:type III polyketide synthase [Alkalicoccobacillus murimartini]|uniref:Alkylresorcinol/alkylpyrone synthase n=1 Tax=Alkalicoccobacillus murimartini TaxID=171685 RepID=A0ABT9YLE6_9BACI|nr:3-oxoacyl-[acyl-carrier-protein] synthase III C-terminal domain-containing protein [Alkalicoccobacillus murimartini]MDQ0208464.1 alkylresorcinol/alkylpyrone synthase [Alkalicoccobacillus murimartini]